jgi:dienelactone hydrolase
MLARHGYGVLLYDRRGEGRSQGDPDSWGWDFDKDIRAGLEFLKHRADVDAARIGGIGLSVGGEMLLQTAAETTDLRAVVAPVRG